MAITNLGELKSSVADWLNREDLTTQIPDFIRLGENRINADFRSRVIANEDAVELTLPSESQQNPISTNLEYEVQTLVVDGDVIPHVTYDMYKRQKKQSTLYNGCWTYLEGSIYYSKFAEPNEAAPAAGGDSVLVEWLGQSLSSLDFTDDTATTLLFLENPELYLYASLVEASTFLRDAEGLQLYQVRYDELMNKVIKAAKRRKFAGGFSVSNVGGDHLFTRRA